MSNVVRLRLKPRMIEPAPKEPTDLLQLAELYSMREAALERGDIVRAAECDRMARELIDGCDY